MLKNRFQIALPNRHGTSPGERKSESDGWKKTNSIKDRGKRITRHDIGASVRIDRLFPVYKTRTTRRKALVTFAPVTIFRKCVIKDARVSHIASRNRGAKRLNDASHSSALPALRLELLKQHKWYANSYKNYANCMQFLYIIVSISLKITQIYKCVLYLIFN